MNLETIAENLERVETIWVAKTSSKVSYPEDGNLHCAQIEDNSFWFQHRNHCIIEMFKQFPPAGTLFDIGGGNGFVAKGLVENGFPTVLVEPGQTGVQNAQKRGLTHIVCATLENARFKPNIMPAVGLFDVIEHIPEDGAFLKVIFDHLEPGGKLYLTVPAYAWLWSPEDDKAGHFKRYTLPHMSHLLQEIGFHVQYATYIFSILPVPIFLFRTLPGKMGFGKSADAKAIKIREHTEPDGLAGSWLHSVFCTEVKRIAKKKSIPFGTSCMMVALRPR